jgi:undecaprenyl diphosphate synthase
MQSPLPNREFHVAVIMDGNGRWAQGRGRPRLVGHRAGAEAVRRAVKAAPELGITTLTLYAFSGDNWGRPGPEVSGLMRLFLKYLRSEVATFRANGIRLTVIGRRDRIPPELRRAIWSAEAETAGGRALHLRIAIDYSAREAIVGAAARLAARGLPASRERFSRMLAETVHEELPGVPDVDLLIRTGGEQRLSDFLLWESAYAELMFTRKMWPEFTARDLAGAVKEFRSRNRRFGLLPEAAAG